MKEATQLTFFKDCLYQDAVSGELSTLLREDLNFHDESNNGSSHNFHSFPAKFPSQLPAKFIRSLTRFGDIVLDPMMGSGTTILEALLNRRNAIGFDIDPLAILITKVKTRPMKKHTLSLLGDSLISEAELTVRFSREVIISKLEHRWDEKTKQFVDYWFAPDTQVEIQALLDQIEKVPEEEIRSFFLLTLSSIIITKSGGVSLALDLGHTRPHKAKLVTDKNGSTIISSDTDVVKHNYNSKILSSPLAEFRKRFNKNVDALPECQFENSTFLSMANAQSLPLRDNTVDLIVTSPPYVSNAIDYMRAHKFSLIWLGYSIDSLGEKRKEYIGGENTTRNVLETLPGDTTRIINQIMHVDKKKGVVVHRYFSEMRRSMIEMLRVLKHGKSAILVVGTSILRGIDTQTGLCLAEIGSETGFYVQGIGIRNLDRNRRMLPVSNSVNLDSQIQNRMHQEYVIGLTKP